MDWVSMVMAMYKSWAQRHGYRFNVVDYMSGEVAGQGSRFHAKEYPAYDKEVFPCYMGYCQTVLILCLIPLVWFDRNFLILSSLFPGLRLNCVSKLEDHLSFTT